MTAPPRIPARKVVQITPSVSLAAHHMGVLQSTSAAPDRAFPVPSLPDPPAASLIEKSPPKDRTSRVE
ncbi:hypothetical protein E2C01_063345 [Portunus trituberculatus]|uniref:Uncharacterized protein n=1 Tax=Portunus trituberculatus TaxID=210409 RepID=A0A5B7HA82_PORTR|nr:hypothetical protein [Portunus trituberculatus]